MMKAKTDKDKRVVVVIGNPISQGSAQVFLRKFTEILCSLGLKIVVLTSGIGSWLFDPRLVLVDLGLDDKKEGKKWWRWIPKFTYMAAQIKASLYLLKARPSIGLVFCLATPHFVPVMLTRLLKMPVFLFAAQNPFVRTRGLLPGKVMEQLYRCASTLAMLFASRIVVESTSMKRTLPKVVSRRKVYAAPVFVPDHFKVLIPFHRREFVVGYIGSFIERKGVIEFARAMAVVLDRSTDIKLLIIGQGPCQDAIERILRGQGVFDRVTLKGWVAHDDLPRYLNQLKLLVLPSYSEGLPNIVLEAMACGTPVLASAVGAIPDVIRDGENGFLLASHSPMDIATTILRIIRSDDLEKISKRARETIEYGFSLEKAVNRYKRLFAYYNDLVH